MTKTASRSRISSLLAGLIGLTLTGCVATTTDVDRLHGSLKTLQKSQADLVIKLDDLDTTLTVLGEKLDENRDKMTSLSLKLDDTQSRIGSRLETITQLLSEATTQATVAIPGDIYRSAHGDYLAGKIDLAISGFKSFLERYPTSDLANQAQFYLADCHLIKKDYVRARIEFDKLLSISRELRPQALLKRAYALEGSKQTLDQKATLKILIKEYPKSTEAQTAEQILEKSDPKSKKKSGKRNPKDKKPERSGKKRSETPKEKKSESSEEKSSE